MDSSKAINRPIIILGAPRSGTTILYRCLALHKQLWHLSGEAHFILEGPLHPAHKGYVSNRVSADDLNVQQLNNIYATFYDKAINLNLVMTDPTAVFSGSNIMGRGYTKAMMALAGRLSKRKKSGHIRFIEKTPKNALRVPLLEQLFPDALYIWNMRNAHHNIDSLITGWYAVDRIGPIKRQRFARSGYPIMEQLKLTDYQGKRWKFALVPEWQRLKGKTVAEVAAWQYYQCNQYIYDDLSQIDPSRIFLVHYEEFISQPELIVHKVLAWADLPEDETVTRFVQIFPRVNSVKGSENETLRHPEEVSTVIEHLPNLKQLQYKMKYKYMM